MIPLHRIAGLIFNRPLLITPHAAQTIAGVWQMHAEARLNGTTVEHERREKEPRATSFIGEILQSENGQGGTPYRVTPDGIAIITVDGELVNRGAWVGADSGLVSYEGIRHQVESAGRDSRVKGILLDINSPGGEAMGLTEAAAAIRAIRKKKPITAFANSLAASAGYGLASAASRRFIAPDGIGGSIGTVLMHMDMSRALANRGVSPTLIFAGAHKVDGNPFEPLPPEVRKDMQAEVEKFYSLFVQTVAAGTGLSEEAIRATEARVYVGQDAVDAGLFDRVASLEEVLADLRPQQLMLNIVTPPRAAAKEKQMDLQPYSNEVKAKLGLPESATDDEVRAAMYERIDRLDEMEKALAAERAEKAEALEREKASALAAAVTAANDQIDAWAKAGKFSGNGAETARALYVALVKGETITPEQFAAHIDALPVLDTSRVKGAETQQTMQITRETWQKSERGDKDAKALVDAHVRKLCEADPKTKYADHYKKARAAAFAA